MKEKIIDFLKPIWIKEREIRIQVLQEPHNIWIKISGKWILMGYYEPYKNIVGD